jgi:hypothetical protein
MLPHGSPSVCEARLGLSRATLVLYRTKGGPPASAPGNMTSRTGYRLTLRTHASVSAVTRLARQMNQSDRFHPLLPPE